MTDTQDDGADGSFVMVSFNAWLTQKTLAQQNLRLSIVSRPCLVLAGKMILSIESNFGLDFGTQKEQTK